MEEQEEIEEIALHLVVVEDGEEGSTWLEARDARMARHVPACNPARDMSHCLSSNLSR